MKQHKRAPIIEEAKVSLAKAVTKIILDYDLTYAELNGILLEAALGWNRYALRAERHPEDPDKPADVE